MSDNQEEIAVQLTDPTEWVDRHGDALFRYARKRLGDRHVSEDLVQETFVAALKSRQFSGQADERTWFIGILKHKIVDHFRRQDRECPSRTVQQRDPMEDLFTERGGWRVRPGPWPANDALEIHDFWEAFRHCLDKLPHRLRTVFSLREIDGQSTEELCDGLQITSGNLGVLLYRARMGLRRCLEVNWFSAETDEV